MRRTALAASLVSLLLLLTSPPAFAQVAVSTFAPIPAVHGLAMDASGRLYASSRGLDVQGGPSGQRNIRLYNPSINNTATIFANSTDGLVDPVGITFDNSGNLIVADYGHQVHSITPGGVASLFATSTNPSPVACDAAGNVYVGEYVNRDILKIAPGGTVSPYVTDVGSHGLHMLYADPDGSLYSGDTVGGDIWRIGPGGSPVTLFANNVGPVRGMAPWVMVPGSWVVTTGDHTLRIVNPDGTHSLYAGATNVTGTTNGPPATARFYYPSGIVYSPSEARYYIADYGNSLIRVLDVVTPVQTTSWGRVKSLYR
jgi:hypothetical protein